MKRIVSLFFAVLLATLLCINVCAEGDNEWKYIIADRGDYIKNNEKIYTNVDFSAGFITRPSQYTVRLHCERCDPTKDYNINLLIGTNEIIFINAGKAGTLVFATDEGKRIISEFNSKNYGSIKIHYKYDAYCYEFSADVLAQWTAKHHEVISNPQSEEFLYTKEPSCKPCMEIVAYDETGSLYKSCGNIYLINDEYYYSSNKRFSYPHTDTLHIRAIKIEGEDLEYLNSVLDDMVADSEHSIPFAIITVVLGILLPAAILVLSIIKGRSKSRPTDKRWFIMAIPTGLLIIMSVVILLVWFI